MGESINAPGFAQLADDLADRCEKLRHDIGKLRAAEGRKLAAEFRSWADHPPSEARRKNAIKDLIDFNRVALDLLAGSRE